MPGVRLKGVCAGRWVGVRARLGRRSGNDSTSRGGLQRGPQGLPEAGYQCTLRRVALSSAMSRAQLSASTAPGRGPHFASQFYPDFVADRYATRGAIAPLPCLLRSEPPLQPRAGPGPMPLLAGPVAALPHPRSAYGRPQNWPHDQPHARHHARPHAGLHSSTSDVGE